MSVGAFRRDLLRQFRAERPSLEVEPVGSTRLFFRTADGDVGEVDLQPIYAAVQRDSLSLSAAVETVMSALDESVAHVGGAHTRVRPLLRHAQTLSAAWNLTPAEPRGPCRHVVGPIWCGYALDDAHTVRLIGRTRADVMGLGDDSIHALAMRNLIGDGAPSVVGEGPVWQLAGDGPYVGAWMMVPEFWRGLQAQCNGAMVVCAPARDVVLFTATGVAGGVEGLRALVAEVEDGLTHRLWSALVCPTDEGWGILEP